jgi:hypothetical protein
MPYDQWVQNCPPEFLVDTINALYRRQTETPALSRNLSEDELKAFYVSEDMPTRERNLDSHAIVLE